MTQNLHRLPVVNISIYLDLLFCVGAKSLYKYSPELSDIHSAQIVQWSCCILYRVTQHTLSMFYCI